MVPKMFGKHVKAITTQNEKCILFNTVYKLIFIIIEPKKHVNLHQGDIMNSNRLHEL